jgi:acyl-phosphate glycerol 3-phosphate acyltransferase
MLILTTAAILVAALLGSLPTGYLVGRRLKGVDVRRLSPYNLGLGTVVDAVGLPVLGLAVALDLAKGVLAVAAGRLLGVSGWAVAAAAAAAFAGHVWSPFRALIPPVAARSKGMAVGLGSVLALSAAGEISWAGITVPLAVAAGVLVLPRAAGRGWGYLSLAAAAAAISLPASLLAVDTRGPYVALGLAFAALAVWNHKEHLLRIADGVEPRLGERLPLPGAGTGEAACAFLIHPMTVRDVWEARRFRWLLPLYRRGLIPDRAVSWMARLARPMKVDDIRPIVTADGRRARVYLIGVPLLPDQIRSEPGLAVRRAVQASDLATNLGATVLGLGAYWSVVGNKGLDVQARSPIAVTNGGAYTAGTIKMAVPLVLARLRDRGVDPARATAAVVGANGVVGFGICRAVVAHIGRLIMVGRDQGRLERSMELLARRHPGAAIEATTRLERLRDADVIFTATSEPQPVVFPEYVREGALLFDLGRPPDVDASVRAVPGAEVIPGGIVRLPGGPRGRIEDLGYGPGLVPACLAETIIIALDACYERASLGERTRSEDVDYFVTRAQALGFEVLAEGVRKAVPGAVAHGLPGGRDWG